MRHLSLLLITFLLTGCGINSFHKQQYTNLKKIEVKNEFEEINTNQQNLSFSVLSSNEIKTSTLKPEIAKHSVETPVITEDLKICQPIIITPLSQRNPENDSSASKPLITKLLSKSGYFSENSPILEKAMDENSTKNDGVYWPMLLIIIGVIIVSISFIRFFFSLLASIGPSSNNDAELTSSAIGMVVGLLIMLLGVILGASINGARAIKRNKNKIKKSSGESDKNN